VKWLQTAWQLLRDVLLTGTGLALIISQVGAREPSSALIVAGLALVVPAATTHAYSVISGPSEAGRGPSPSSPSPPPPSSSPSSPPAATGEHGA
jgi:hypothetical protein